MSIERRQFIEFYAQQVRKGDTSLFLGAGISASAGYPSWKSLLEPCAKQLRIEIEENMDFFHLAQYYANEYGSSALKRIINDSVNCLKDESILINELLNIKFKTIWTTNFDTVLENNLSRRNILTNRIYDDKDLANISMFNRVNIYKLNGDISNLDKIVITQSDLETYENRHELLLTFFKRELVGNTFLFLGYSFTDSIVLSCLNSINKCLGESANHHFTVLKKINTSEFLHFIRDLEIRYHIKVLLIDDYDELPLIVKELNREIHKSNIFFSGVFERLEPVADIFAETLCKGLSHELLSKNYHIYTGYGRNFGNYLAGSSIQYLLAHNLEIDRHLIMRPFLKTMTEEQKRTHREMLIGDCSVSIFMYGQTPFEDKYVNANGMIKEFEIARRLGKFIIPVGCTGFTAQEIWKDVKKNIVEYPYLEKYIEILNTPNAEKIIAAILQILKEVSE